MKISIKYNASIFFLTSLTNFHINKRMECRLQQERNWACRSRVTMANGGAFVVVHHLFLINKSLRVCLTCGLLIV